jgi:hypothetical protein
MSPGSAAGYGKEINGVERLDARVLAISASRPIRATVTTVGALAWSGFRRYATHHRAVEARRHSS